MLAVNFSEFIDPNPRPGNEFGHSVVPLSTGNVVITSPYDNAGGVDAGAVYLFNGQTGALISTLTGSTNDDHVGLDGVTALTGGNYVVASFYWDNNGVRDAGAVTWGSGISGISGVVSDQNSLVGSNRSDYVGLNGVTPLTNGNYVVASGEWDNSNLSNAGAVTWGSGISGISGVVSDQNSLVGSNRSDHVGFHGVTPLTNGNYVVASANWNTDTVDNVGAVTWANGTTGISGVVSDQNSLVGSTEDDHVGLNGMMAPSFGNGVTALANGNYVVASSVWDNNSVINAGAVTWGSGTTGISGVVSDQNSLVGSTVLDQVGYSDVTALTNGNYVVASSNWDNNSLINAGAVTWGNGTVGISGIVSDQNSLVGSTADDQVGYSGVTALTNGNYVVASGTWDKTTVINAGAVTWANGTSGISGIVSDQNSLIGSTAGDAVGYHGVTALTNGNYVVASNNWNTAAGAVTWVSGTTGISGVVSDQNSLVGSKANQKVGSDGVTTLTNGNYVVASGSWDNGNRFGVGAVTWGSGTTGISGIVSDQNSLVGPSYYDFVGNSGVIALTNGNYVVPSSYWDNNGVTQAGAVTWSSGISGISGTVTDQNSLVGSTAWDYLGYPGVTALTNGNYVVAGYSWDNNGVINAGAVTWSSGTAGISGVINANNSMIGESSNSGLTDIVADDVNRTYYARFLTEGSGRVRVGDQHTGIDFGDAPDSYPTLDVDNGAMHYVVGPRLGNTRDSETDGVPTIDAQGDGGDEDGISLPQFLIDTVATIDVDVQNALGTVYLDAWIDFNQDGDWDDTGEQIYASEPVVSGVNQVEFTVPSDAELGNTYARFRLSSAGGLSPSGLADDGEVEDYLVSIEATAWYDMAVVTMPTTTNADGSVAAVPYSMSVVHEWQDYFIEVYTQVSSETPQPITNVEFTLDFDTSLINLDLANIQKGAGIINLAHGLFPGQLIISGTLDGSNPDLGIGSPFLVARVPASSMAVANVSGVYSDESNVTLPVMEQSSITLKNINTPLVATNAATPSTTIKAVPYDINDDDRVGLVDLSMLVNAFGQSTTNSDLAYRSDFDQNGSVGLSDLARLVNHFGYAKGDGKTISFPTIIEGEAVGLMLEGQPVVDENFASIFVGQAVPDVMAEPVFNSRQAQPDLQRKFTTTPMLEAEPIRSIEKTIENLEPLNTPYELDALWSAEYELLTEDERLLELAAVSESSFSSRISNQDQADLADDLFAEWGLS
ncbi:MAG: hypothetical protein COA78_04500 [Blastopirellula sp.]|nr:MAG: hypothetical protein COA78_04500 [Blastopirellula sp.]